MHGWLAELDWVWQQWVRGVLCGSHREADTLTLVPSPLSQIECLIQLELRRQVLRGWPYWRQWHSSTWLSLYSLVQAHEPFIQARPVPRPRTVPVCSTITSAFLKMESMLARGLGNKLQAGKLTGCIVSGQNKPSQDIRARCPPLPTSVGGIVDLMEFRTSSGVPQVPCSLSQGKRVLASVHVYPHPKYCIHCL